MKVAHKYFLFWIWMFTFVGGFIALTINMIQFP